jgi:HSP20 family protein
MCTAVAQAPAQAPSRYPVDDFGRSLRPTTLFGIKAKGTTSRGPFPPINVFQQGEDILALMELPGIDKNELQIQAKANTIRISGKKRVDYSNDVSVHRRERVSGEFDRTLSLPVQVDPDRIRAEYRDGLLALFLPRAESDKPRSIKLK